MKKISSQCLREKDASYTNFIEESKIYLSQCYGMTEVISSNNRFYQKDSELSLVLYSKLKSSLQSFLVIAMPKEQESGLYNSIFLQNSTFVNTQDIYL